MFCLCIKLDPLKITHSHQAVLAFSWVAFTDTSFGDLSSVCTEGCKKKFNTAPSQACRRDQSLRSIVALLM